MRDRVQPIDCNGEAERFTTLKVQAVPARPFGKGTLEETSASTVVKVTGSGVYEHVASKKIRKVTSLRMNSGTING